MQKSSEIFKFMYSIFAPFDSNTFNTNFRIDDDLIQ
jgi:hypothetical protein